MAFSAEFASRLAEQAIELPSWAFAAYAESGYGASIVSGSIGVNQAGWGA
jgi:hypothetical protein